MLAQCGQRRHKPLPALPSGPTGPIGPTGVPLPPGPTPHSVLLACPPRPPATPTPSPSLSTLAAAVAVAPPVVRRACGTRRARSNPNRSAADRSRRADAGPWPTSCTTSRASSPPSHRSTASSRGRCVASIRENAASSGPGRTMALAMVGRGGLALRPEVARPRRSCPPCAGSAAEPRTHHPRTIGVGTSGPGPTAPRSRHRAACGDPRPAGGGGVVGSGSVAGRGAARRRRQAARAAMPNPPAPDPGRPRLPFARPPDDAYSLRPPNGQHRP
jgi:hypothetical protein